MNTDLITKLAIIVICLMIIAARCLFLSTPQPPAPLPYVPVPPPMIPWGSMAPGPRPATVRGAPFVECCDLSSESLPNEEWVCMEGVVYRWDELWGSLLVRITCDHCDDGIVHCTLKNTQYVAGEGTNVILYGKVRYGGLSEAEFISPKELKQELSGAAVLDVDGERVLSLSRAVCFQ